MLAHFAEQGLRSIAVFFHRDGMGQVACWTTHPMGGPSGLVQRPFCPVGLQKAFGILAQNAHPARLVSQKPPQDGHCLRGGDIARDLYGGADGRTHFGQARSQQQQFAHGIDTLTRQHPAGHMRGIAAVQGYGATKGPELARDDGLSPLSGLVNMGDMLKHLWRCSLLDVPFGKVGQRSDCENIRKDVAKRIGKVVGLRILRPNGAHGITLARAARRGLLGIAVLHRASRKIWLSRC